MCPGPACSAVRGSKSSPCPKRTLDGRQSNHDSCCALKSPMTMDLGVMGRRRKGSMGESGSMYAAVTVQLSIMLMVTLSQEPEKLSMRLTILFTTYAQTQGGGGPGEASENDK